jgi:hypothetical protein
LTVEDPEPVGTQKFACPAVFDPHEASVVQFSMLHHVSLLQSAGDVHAVVHCEPESVEHGSPMSPLVAPQTETVDETATQTVPE